MKRKSMLMALWLVVSLVWALSGSWIGAGSLLMCLVVGNKMVERGEL